MTNMLSVRTEAPNDSNNMGIGTSNNIAIHDNLYVIQESNLQAILLYLNINYYNGKMHSKMHSEMHSEMLSKSLYTS